MFAWHPSAPASQCPLIPYLLHICIGKALRPLEQLHRIWPGLVDSRLCLDMAGQPVVDALG